MRVDEFTPDIQINNDGYQIQDLADSNKEFKKWLKHCREKKQELRNVLNKASQFYNKNKVGFNSQSEFSKIRDLINHVGDIKLNEQPFDAVIVQDEMSNNDNRKQRFERTQQQIEEALRHFQRAVADSKKFNTQVTTMKMNQISREQISTPKYKMLREFNKYRKYELEKEINKKHIDHYILPLLALVEYFSYSDEEARSTYRCLNIIFVGTPMCLEVIACIFQAMYHLVLECTGTKIPIDIKKQEIADEQNVLNQFFPEQQEINEDDQILNSDQIEDNSYQPECSQGSGADEQAQLGPCSNNDYSYGAIPYDQTLLNQQSNQYCIESSGAHVKPNDNPDNPNAKSDEENINDVLPSQNQDTKSESILKDQTQLDMLIKQTDNIMGRPSEYTPNPQQN